MFDLKEFRKINNLTQEQAADYFGCGQGFISQMERGKRPVPDAYMSKIKKNGKYVMPEPAYIGEETKNHINITKIDQAMYERLLEEKDMRIKNLESQITKYHEIIDSLIGRLATSNKQTGS